MFVVKKRFFNERCGLNFFPRKCPVALELNLTHRKLTKVVEQTHNMSTWSDRSKTLPSTSCLLEIRKSNETLLQSGLGLLAKEYEKKPELRTHENNSGFCRPKRRVGYTS